MDAIPLLSFEFARQLEDAKVEELLGLLSAADVFVRDVDGDLPLAGSDSIVTVMVDTG